MMASIARRQSLRALALFVCFAAGAALICLAYDPDIAPVLAVLLGPPSLAVLPLGGIALVGTFVPLVADDRSRLMQAACILAGLVGYAMYAFQ